MSAKREMLCVTWKDACSEDAWKHESEVEPSLSVIVSVGLFVAENEETLTIAVNHDTNSDNFSCIMHIPLGWISSRKVLTVKRGPRKTGEG